ncbi:response regulator [Glycomyces algeriensis]|uniref:DNA-binding response regulator n=1 Tax=Glycomyces algeriensis TaxID=256037 RepID=A0A9W6GAL2_9ACTN|nr:response regulator transcription factor [Glycomyces algeriensis]MDA1364785.1 response regulator transcription factor [Glycomyces algeriensis]MDR7350826.1 DNA-binding NarL/FixJ family response regulator [Glycomyces algeriensis]GLI43536.1 DNA-binding response regulator [Glycomyces algeriensis]
MATLIVVDDHPIWREAIARDLTAAGHRVLAVCGEGRAALTAIRELRPDVAILDLQLPDLTGVGVLQGLGEDCPTAVLILSASGESSDVLEAMKAGARGYLVKSASAAELADAVERVAAGDAVFTPGLAGLVLGEYRRLANANEEERPKLSERETEVLRLVAKGLNYREIAERLVLSQRTVQNHVQHILTKLQLHNRSQLVRYAIEQGIDGD